MYLLQPDLYKYIDIILYFECILLHVFIFFFFAFIVYTLFMDLTTGNRVELCFSMQ